MGLRLRLFAQALVEKGKVLYRQLAPWCMIGLDYDNRQGDRRRKAEVAGISESAIVVVNAMVSALVFLPAPTT